MNDDLDRDPEAAELAKRLARTDFSADSRVRLSLRARLLSRGSERPTPAFRYAAAVCMAAGLLVLGYPLTRPRTAPAARRYARGENGLPVMPGRLLEAGGPGGALVQTAVASVAETAGRRSISWTLDGATYVLETRRTSLDEIFEKPKI